MLCRLVLLALLLGGAQRAAIAAPPPRAAGAADSRPARAKEAFAAGRYDEALQIFVKLYAETLDPIYLRVIGRCYQNLDAPEKAIHSFREYLRKSPRLEAAKRAEIEGYIAEMNQLLQRRQAAPAAVAPETTPAPPAAEPLAAPAPAPLETAPVPPPPPAPPPVLAAPAPQPPAPAPAVAALSAPAPATAPTESRSHAWLWILVGSVVLAAGAATLLLLRTPSDPSCPPDTHCF